MENGAAFAAAAEYSDDDEDNDQDDEARQKQFPPDDAIRIHKHNITLYRMLQKRGNSLYFCDNFGKHAVNLTPFYMAV